MSNISASAFSDTKAHYELLDGRRGVAALMVIWYHVFEGFAFVGNSAIETLNHGYFCLLYTSTDKQPRWLPLAGLPRFPYP